MRTSAKKHLIDSIFLYRIDDKWKDVKISSQNPDEHRLRAVRAPGQRSLFQLQIGGTVSSTSSVHPTKETWLNIQNSSQLSLDSATERPTMRDLQERFAEVPISEESTSSNAVVYEDGEGTSSNTAMDGVHVTHMTLDKSTDSSV